MNLRFIHPYPARWLLMPIHPEVLIPRVGCFCFIYSVLASSLIFSLASSATYLLSHILYHTSSIQHLLSSIFYPASSITYRLSHIFYHVSSISHLPFRISHLNFSFRICICIYRFAFAFFVLNLHFSFCISHLASNYTHTVGFTLYLAL